MSGVRRRVTVLALGAALAGVALSGCTTPAEPDGPRNPSPTSSPSPSDEPAPVFVPGGTAEENRDAFDYVIRAQAEGADGRSYIDALVAAGFDRATMQLTQDATPLGNAVDSVMFSVIVSGECLIGQRHGSGITSTIAPVLGGGGCLVGTTRAIDW